MKSLKEKSKATLAMVLVLTMVLSLTFSMTTLAAPAEASAISMTTMTTQVDVTSVLRMIFSARCYADKYPDLLDAYGYDEEALYQHAIQKGIYEGRDISPVINLKEYRDGHADLKKFGNDWMALLDHYLKYGMTENAAGKRSARGILFNPIVYAAEHPELGAPTEDNLLRIVQHYITNYADKGVTTGKWMNPPEVTGVGLLTKTTAVESNVTDNSTDSVSVGGSEAVADRVDDMAKDTGTSSVPDENNSGTVQPPTPVNPGDSGDTDDSGDVTDPKPHSHTLASFDESGNCKTAGCTYKLSDFQAVCLADHSQIDIGETCANCGAAGTNDPNETHTQSSPHTKNSFDANGECKRGCGLTLAVFQANCPQAGGHGDILLGQTCPECGIAGAKITEANCPNKANHGDIPKGETCSGGCGYVGTKVTPDNCDNKANHGILHKGQKCSDCGYEGVLDHSFVGGSCSCGATITSADCPDVGNHADLYPDQNCGTCGATGTKQCDGSEHADIYIDDTCPHCGANGVKLYDQASCPNGSGHSVGTACTMCGYDGACTADHSLIYTTKTCDLCHEPGTKVCEVDHAALDKGTFCECGVEGTKEAAPPELEDDEQLLNAPAMVAPEVNGVVDANVSTDVDTTEVADGETTDATDVSSEDEENDEETDEAGGADVGNAMEDALPENIVFGDAANDGETDVEIDDGAKDETDGGNGDGTDEDEDEQQMVADETAA